MRPGYPYRFPTAKQDISEIFGYSCSEGPVPGPKSIMRATLGQHFDFIEHTEASNFPGLGFRKVATGDGALPRPRGSARADSGDPHSGDAHPVDLRGAGFAWTPRGRQAPPTIWNGCRDHPPRTAGLNRGREGRPPGCGRSARASVPRRALDTRPARAGRVGRRCRPRSRRGNRCSRGGTPNRNTPVSLCSRRSHITPAHEGAHLTGCCERHPALSRLAAGQLLDTVFRTEICPRATFANAALRSRVRGHYRIGAMAGIRRIIKERRR